MLYTKANPIEFVLPLHTQKTENSFIGIKTIETIEIVHITLPTGKEKVQSKDKETRLHSFTRTSKAKTTYRRKSKNSRKTQEKRREQPTFPTT